MKPNSAIVAAFAEAMRRGDIFPPIFIQFSRRAETFTVINGLHRTAASLALGYTHIPANFLPAPK